MQRRLWLVLGVLAFAGAFAAPAAADDFETCDMAKGDASIAACSRLIASGNRKNINLAAAHYNRGHAYLESGDQDQALTDFNEAIRLDARMTDAFNGRGTVYLDKGDNDRAIADYSRAIRLDPKLVSSLYGRGNAYRRKGDQARALADYNVVLRLDPQNSGAFNGRGMIFADKNDPDRAISDYNAAIRIEPQYKEAFSNRGNAYLDKDDFDHAIADYNEALRIDPQFANAFFGRAGAFDGKGDLDRALADYSEALRLRPDDTDFQDAATKIKTRLAARPKPAEIAATPAPAAVTAPPRLSAPSAPTVPAASVPAATAPAAVAPALAALPSPAALPPPAVASPAVPAPAIHERRVALVVGNSAYKGSAQLRNPVNDADDVSAALRAVGFEVIEGKDLTLRGFSQIIGTFRDKAMGADVALLYYSGHGMQFEDQNWLMPVDTEMTSAFDVRHYNVALQDLLGDIETRAKTTLVFLDACRNNPLDDDLKSQLKAQGRGFAESRGFKRIEVQTPQTLVVFATRPNTTAADGDSRNSPFTEAFLKHVATPGVEIEVLMKRVTTSVAAMTSGKQQPERLSRLEQEFYFVPAK